MPNALRKIFPSGNRLSEECTEPPRLNEVQTRVVRELASGVSRYDPARDPDGARRQAKNTYLIDVQQLKYCHSTISHHFMHGKHRGLPVISLLEDLHAGKVYPRELPPLVVMMCASALEVVCGNRRLYCLQRYAAETGNPVDVWCVVYDLKAQETPRNLVMKYILAKTTEDGSIVDLRKGS